MTGKILPSLAILAGLASVARAELPPGSYDSMRFKADEAVIIEVESVTTKDLKPGWTGVVLSARVVAVERSRAGLKKGDRVTIRYEHLDRDKVAEEEPFAGGSVIPILAKGETYPAYLRRDEGKRDFEPAADRSSFQMTPESPRP